MPARGQLMASLRLHYLCSAALVACGSALVVGAFHRKSESPGPVAASRAEQPGPDLIGERPAEPNATPAAPRMLFPLPSSDAPATREELERYTALLGDPAWRHEAQVWLMSRQRTTAKVLEELRSSTPDAQRALDEVLASFVPAPDSNGLRITLLADKSDVRTMDFVNFVVIVRNTLDEPLNLYVAGGLRGKPAGLESGRHLRLKDASGELQPPWARATPRCGLLCGGELRGPKAATLSAGSALVYRIRTQWIDTRYLLLSSDLVFDVAGEAQHRFVLPFTVSESSARYLREAAARSGGFGATIRCWEGTAVSNEVVLRVAP